MTMDNISVTTLRYEIFSTESRTGPGVGLDKLKEIAHSYINQNDLADRLVNISESVYAWARGDRAGVSRATVTVWFRYPDGQDNPVRTQASSVEASELNSK